MPAVPTAATPAIITALDLPLRLLPLRLVGVAVIVISSFATAVLVAVWLLARRPQGLGCYRATPDDDA
jgi:hypothetical protein